MPPNFKKKKHPRKNKNHHHQSIDKETYKEEEADTKSALTESVTEENNNKPYIVKYSDVCGRYLVASRDLKAGEKIIEVEPLAIGPWAESDPVCLGCHRPFLKGCSTVRCTGCGWQICSPNCSGLEANNAHKSLECIPLKEHNVIKLFSSSSVHQIKLMYEAIFTLRCLLLKKTDPEKYSQLLEMESLNELRQQNCILWKRNQEAIVERIRNDWKFEEFSESEIHTICGIIEVNSFQIGQNDVHARALYPEAFYIMHDCTPNTTHTDDPETNLLSIRLTKDLKTGDPITLSYSYTLQGTLKRRQHLFDSKFFWCRCQRCSDPTEFGSNCSTLICTKCSNGLVLSTNPLDQESDWKCKSCEHIISAEIVTRLLDRLFKEVDAIDGNSIELYEKFIDSYKSTLHFNHYLFLSAKHSLCQLYGKISGYLIPDMSLQQIKHKEILCRDLLSVVDLYEPGLSRLRGVIMYELHVPIMILAKYQFETHQINNNQLKRKLNEALKLLKESAMILSFEPAGSPEYEMATAACDAVEKMGSLNS
ncbi:SET domain-containing protein SmydA-8 [Malaya genurostris]|uniref:SET domain-containing protein SmydA-8 n=1 Tax=Malaya genurostris TaxID=325434 RepID=UPI0026F3FCDC|nr:SET domain-containing protein SmydA-8 [Malaya genurostris]XP_058460575.1 SET domain-containing protein SmydA-8 [Malaya genurostris]XP_058460576.1 SET domain-containing protein SmydA-8 [Malaya genurostris]XP_058460577.1 SET domain-containing protein SmydA-8 [Malaya genurostris]